MIRGFLALLILAGATGCRGPRWTGPAEPITDAEGVEIGPVEWEP